MPGVRVIGFGGENRALHATLLPETSATVSLNHRPLRGDLRPWRSPTTVATVTAGSKSIYRMGRDVPSDTNYWLAWPTPTNVVRGFNQSDNNERTYFTGSGTPKWTDTVKALGGGAQPVATRELGVPAPLAAPTLSASGGVSTTNVTRAYAYTYVNDADHESAPSPAALITCKQDATVSLTGLSAAPSGSYGINRIRVYRSESGSASSDYFFVREVAVTTSTTDPNLAIGDPLETSDWIPAPGIPQGGLYNLTEPTLTCLTGMWNEMMAGISGRGVRFCEPGAPYAWPLKYEIAPADYSPVALGVFGQTLVVLTNGNPTLVGGTSPDSLDEQPLDFLQACVSAQSVVSMGHGVAWASPDGLAYVGAGGARLLTAGCMTREDWQALNPASIIGAMWEGRYYGFYQPTAGNYRAFMLDPADASGLYFMDFGADAVYVDDLQDVMYVLQGGNVRKWDAGSALTVTWRSKEFRLGKPMTSMAVGQVLADTYPVTFKLIADSVQRFSGAVSGPLPFWLPSGYYAERVQMEVSTSGSLQSIAVAHSVDELKGV